MSTIAHALSTTPKPTRRIRWRHIGLQIGIYGVLIVWTLLIYFPLYYILITSFKKPVDVARGSLIPWVQFEPVLTAWQDVLVGTQSPAVIKHYSNSLIIGIGAALLTTVLGAMAGYGLSRFRYHVLWMKNDGLAFWFISQRMLPPVAVVLAYLLLYRDLRLLDTQIGLILAYIGFNLPLVVWVMRDFFQQIPREIEESAAIDGASRWLIFWRIAMPLAIPGLIASFLLALIFSFNEYLFAVILSATNSTTFPILLAAQFTGDSIRFWILSALALMNIIPAAIVALVLERYIVRGLFAGAVKQ
ncbi:MAG: carbohydrate ABC transporter permease [Chloroflexi bacterium]|nr:carbohydrate ABC transporter permease [Chloroflexota bacterium]